MPAVHACPCIVVLLRGHGTEEHNRTHTRRIHPFPPQQAVRGRPSGLADAALTRLAASLLGWLEKVAQRDAKVTNYISQCTCCMSVCVRTAVLVSSQSTNSPVVVYA